MRNTLLVYLHGIGDNIMLTGVLREYCRLHPEEKVDLVVLNPACQEIWKNNSLLGKVQLYPDRQPHYWNPIQFYLFDKWKVLSFVKKLKQSKNYHKVCFPTIQTLPEILYHFTGTYGRHKIDRMCVELGVPARLYPYHIITTPADMAAADQFLSAMPHNRLAVLHPFSSDVKKRIGPAGFSKILHVLERHGYTPLVVGAPLEKAQFDSRWKTASAFGLPFGVLVEILKQTQVFVGTDSAVAHLAAAANTKRVIIFSSKIEPARYLPVSEQSQIQVMRLAADGENASPEKEFSQLLETP